MFLLYFSRDSRIRQLELELVAAPKQEKVERSVLSCIHAHVMHLRVCQYTYSRFKRRNNFKALECVHGW